MEHGGADVAASRSKDGRPTNDLGAAIAKNTGVLGSAMRAATTGSLERPHGAHTVAHGRRVREKARAQAPRGLPLVHEELLRYERSLRVCERRHGWAWKPDAQLCACWQSMNPTERAAVLDVESAPAFNEWCGRIHASTCLVCNVLDVVQESAIFQDVSSRDVFTEFFRIAVSDNAPLAVTMEVIEAVDNTVQDFCASRVGDHPGHGPDSPFVDPRTFAVGSINWVRYREREHTRLLCMCHMLQLFEDRLVEAFEKGQGAKLAQQQQDAADRAMRELLAVEDTARPTKGKKGKAEQRKRQQHHHHQQEQEQQQQHQQQHPPSAPSSSRGPHAPPSPERSSVSSCGSSVSSCGSSVSSCGSGGSSIHSRGSISSTDGGGGGGGGGRGGSESTEQRHDQRQGRLCGDGPANRSKNARRRQRKRANKAARDVLSMAASQHSEGQPDEIDAEFARRVAEHIKARREASVNTTENTNRKNKVLKLLCAKLKANLETKLAEGNA